MHSILLVCDSLALRVRITELLAPLFPEVEILSEASSVFDRRGLILDQMLAVLFTGVEPERTLAQVQRLTAGEAVSLVVVREHDGVAPNTFRQAGALSVVEMLDGDSLDSQKWRKDLVLTLKASLKVRPLSRRRPASPPAEHSNAAKSAGARKRVVCIGASTGGPQTLARLFAGVPALTVPTVVVMHCRDDGAQQLREWLAKVASMPVVLASHGVEIESLSGKIVLAPPDRHLRFSEERILLTSEPHRHFCRPSVDITFESAAECLGDGAVGVLLTGMGSDGAAGLLKLRQRGAVTIAQDEASSVVFGMPRAAILLDAAGMVLPDSEIALYLRRRFS